MSNDKLFEMMIKYKNQVTGLICIALAMICFVGGRLSVDIPPREVICKTEIATKEKLFTQLKECQDGRVVALQAQRDADDIACDKRIEKEVQQHKEISQQLNCDIVKSLYGQCKRRGLIK